MGENLTRCVILCLTVKLETKWTYMISSPSDNLKVTFQIAQRVNCNRRNSYWW
jgi:hypothetical protein